MKRFAVISCLFSAALLGGCGAPAALPAPDAEVIFKVYAGMVFRQTQSKAAQRFNVIWERRRGDDGDEDEIFVRDVFGNTRARLAFSERNAILHYGGNNYTAKNAHELAQRLLGFAAPVESFSFWLRGESDPNASAYEKIKPGGLMLEIKQDDWHIVYHEHSDDELPKVFTFYMPNDAGRVDVDIKKWLQTPPSEK